MVAIKRDESHRESKPLRKRDRLKAGVVRFTGAFEFLFLFLYPLLLPFALIALVLGAVMVKDWQSFFHEWGHYLLLAGLLVAIWLEVWRKRIDEREAGQIRDARAQREVELLEERLELETRAHLRQTEFLQKEIKSLGAAADQISGLVARELADDPTWAAQALQKAKIHVGPRSLFSIRSEHFHDEKKRIAERFLPLLILRFQYHHDKDKIILLIDSGTTVHPIVESLGAIAVAARKEGESWVDKLEVWTNNLPGILTLMDVGRVDSANPYSPLAFGANLLPGVPVPAFASVAGELTQRALSDVRLRFSGCNVVFISLVTGNWIRIRETVPRCPIPLARGYGHLGFKQTLFDYADEVFVIAPLGKIFADTSPQRRENVSDVVNSDLHLHEGGAQDFYREVDVNPEDGAKVKLISTARALSGRVLSAHSRTVEDRAMAVCEGDELEGLGGANTLRMQFSQASIEEVYSVMFSFNDFPNDRIEERRIEFPHDYITPQLMKTYFQVSGA